MKQGMTTFLCALLFSWGASSSALASTSWTSASLRHDGLERHFRYYLPSERSETPPLVILLHGGTRSMTKLFRRTSGATRAWPELAQTEGFVLMTPNGTNEKTGDPKGNRQNWNDCRTFSPGSAVGSVADDVGFIQQLIAWSHSNLNVDTARIYVTGASNGGMMSFRLALELSDEIAAAAAFIANMPVKSECSPAIAPVPMMIVNGTEDPLIPWEGGTIKNNRGDVLSTQDTLEFWLSTNSANVSQAKTAMLPDTSKRDKSSVRRTYYPASTHGAEVLFFQVINGGHTIPHPSYVIPRFIRKVLIGEQNRDFDSVQAAWEFLSRQRVNSH